MTPDIVTERAVCLVHCRDRWLRTDENSTRRADRVIPRITCHARTVAMLLSSACTAKQAMLTSTMG